MSLGLPSSSFRPLVYGVGAWSEHIHFAYDLVALYRPKVLVELGTDRGESYFTFCQSAQENQTGTRCFAVDSWQGDQHVGGYDESTFQEVEEHNRANYSSFSTLIRSGFNNALSRFANSSIDLLHIDGLHTEAAVRHDLETWLPKLRPGGILLMHDATVRRRDFGVWKVWAELQSQGRAFTFNRGAGLGFWQKTPPTMLVKPLESLLNQPGETTEALLQHYDASFVNIQRQIASQWADQSIRHTAIGKQTIIQIFYVHDGTYSEEHSVLGRIGHNEWKHVQLDLPPNAAAGRLRIDFVSAFTSIEVAEITLTADDTCYHASSAELFLEIELHGNAERLSHPEHLHIQVTGQDPQLHLPFIPGVPLDRPLRLELRLRVQPYS